MFVSSCHTYPEDSSSLRLLRHRRFHNSVLLRVIGDFTTGDGVKRPVRQRVFPREKNSNPSARRKLFFFTRMHIPWEGQ